MQKIRAGSLQFVLFVGAVVAVLLLSFALVSYSHNIFQKKTDVMVNVIQAVDHGLLNTNENLQGVAQKDLDIKVDVEKTFWGVLEKRHAKAQKGKFQFEKIAFVGPSDSNRPALYLKDDQRPLVVAGNTRIAGTAFLPERGMKMGNIYGNSYYDSRLLYGEQKKSSAQIPRFHPEFQTQLTKLTQPYFEADGEEVALKQGLVLKNSFKNATQVIKGHHIVLKQATLSGNIIVWATKKIVVDAGSKLQDVVLIAPNIEVQNWTKGNFQALANEKIHVGKGCELRYPTVLAINQQKQDSLAKKSIEPNLFIDAYAEVRGMIIYRDLDETNRYRPHIKINDHAKIVGEVFSSQNVELKGSIHGNVTTASFVALENGNIYQNHLYNGKINSSLLPLAYGGIPYATNDKPKQVMKWLY